MLCKSLQPPPWDSMEKSSSVLSKTLLLESRVSRTNESNQVSVITARPWAYLDLDWAPARLRHLKHSQEQAAHAEERGRKPSARQWPVAIVLLPMLLLSLAEQALRARVACQRPMALGTAGRSDPSTAASPLLLPSAITNLAREAKSPSRQIPRQMNKPSPRIALELASCERQQGEGVNKVLSVFAATAIASTWRCQALCGCGSHT